MLRKKYSQPISEESIARILEKLAAAGLVHREGERYLSLATRKAYTVAPRPHRERMSEAALTASGRLASARAPYVRVDLPGSSGPHVQKEFVRTHSD
jgi:hypothetical protein